MNLLQNAFRFRSKVGSEADAETAATLVSATCIGNEGKSCPLLHGSLGPMLLAKSEAKPQYKSNSRFREFLLQSNCITWTPAISLMEGETASPEIISKLPKTRYSSKSVKEVMITCFYNSDMLNFVRTNCPFLEKLTMIVGSESYSLMAALPNLTTLVNLSFLPKTLVYLHLHFSVDEVVAGGVNTLPDLPALRTLIIKGCLSDSNLKHICEKAPNLEVLEFNGGENLTDAGFQELQKLEFLNALSL
jgi:hypothetical protein